MKQSIPAAVALLVAGLAVPMHDLSAQARDTPTGSRIEREYSSRELRQDRAGRFVDEFARCVYDRNRTEVPVLFAASDPATIDYEELGLVNFDRFRSAFAMDRCMEDVVRLSPTGVVISTSPTSLRLMMMERAYLEAYPSPPNWLGQDVAVPERSYVSEGEALASARGLADFADCIVAAAPRESDALLRTPRRSEAENIAVQPIITHLGPCLAEGHTLGLEIENVRQFVADGLWQRASAYADGSDN
ncbi:hypothetical protein [Parasphingopyxis sp.]|uniref:hypothetical protein n=1 Tax=Parasphingopyxis sp. TaxID=1920299 RepID=UPI00261D0027|nr:hypothetical protein [Parasphingopyxis sp.]